MKEASPTRSGPRSSSALGPVLYERLLARHPDLAVVFVSGYPRELDSSRLPGERTPFLPKPFSIQELLEAVDTVLAPGAGTPR